MNEWRDLITQSLYSRTINTKYVWLDLTRGLGNMGIDIITINNQFITTSNITPYDEDHI